MNNKPYERAWIDLFVKHGRWQFWEVGTNDGMIHAGRVAGMNSGLICLAADKDNVHVRAYINPRRISWANRFLPIKKEENGRQGAAEGPQGTLQPIEGAEPPMFKCEQCETVKMITEQFPDSGICYACAAKEQPPAEGEPVEADEVIDKDGEVVE